MAIQATGRATFMAVEDYDIVFVLNGIRCDVLNFDSVRTAESAALEADFYNGGTSCVVDKAVLCCYDGEGTLLGSPIEVHDTSTAVADGGSLYLSKDCKTITCDIYAGDKKLCSKTLPVIRDGSSVGVKAVSYKVINNVAANASLNWDSVTSQTAYPTQKPDKGKYCYVMTIVLYTDGTSTNTVSTSYTPNDGNNGTSVKVTSTKVEYAGGDSGTTAPTSGWQGTVPQLSQGKYLWTRTTVAYSDGNSTTSYSVGRIGMDGSKGGTTHILYASSDHPSSADDVRTTIDAGHQYYGTYQDTEVDDDVKNWPKVKRWVLVKGEKGDPGKDGKDAVTYGVQVTPHLDWLGVGQTDPGIQIQFTRTTGATVETFTNVTKLGGLVQVYVDGVYHADATDYINRGNDKIVFSHFPIDNTSTGKTIGTASTIGIELLVNSTVVATASYANGKQGADGKGALEIICDPETIVLNTDDNGRVTDTSISNAWAALMCLRDGKEVSGVTYKIGKTANCSATVNDNGIVAITSVTTQEVAVDGNTVSVSSTSGSVTVSVTETATGVTYTKTVPFTVNMAKYTGGLEADKKKLQSQYSLLTNNGSITSLTEYKSEILQTAKEISLKVSEKSVGRRNMLVGSACRKYGDGFVYMSGSQTQYYNGYPLEQIEINSGIDGVNCIHCRTKQYATDGAYSSGFRWNGDSPQGNIKLEKGKNYVLSFYAKTHTPNNIYFVAEAIYQGSNTDTTRPYGYDGPTGYSTIFSASEADKWELFTVKLSVPSEPKSEYVEVCIFARATGYSFVDVYICKPMLEEGDEYNGWTLSEQDYDYVGGNLLDGTGTLTKTGNVEVLDEKTVKQGGYNNESASVGATLSPTAAYNDFLRYSTTGMGLKAGEDYTLSFYARSSGKGVLECYLNPSSGSVMTESSHEKINGVWNPNDGNLRTPIAPTTEWKRYWVHWRPTVNDPQHVLFRLLRPGTSRGSYNSSTSYNVGDVVLYGGTYYVCKKAGYGSTLGAPGSSSYWEASWFSIEIARPKLEVGATMTEWTEKRADMVDKRALLATGIDIDSKKITATADKFVVQNNSGVTTFSVDKDGNIVGAGNAMFKGAVTATTFTLSSDKFYVDNNGKFKLSMTYFSVDETGKINATGGSISFFNFDYAGMSSGVVVMGGKIVRGVGMEMSNISVSGDNNNRISSVYLGNGMIDARWNDSHSRQVYRVGSTSIASTFYNYIKLERIGSGSYTFENDPEHAALGIETQGDFCLTALGGPSQFAGMCLASNSGSSFTGDKMHSFYLCSGGTFTMPGDPPDGMLLIVIQTGSKITFNGNGHQFRSGTNYHSTCNSNSVGQWTMFYFDGSYWNTVYMNGRPW